MHLAVPLPRCWFWEIFLVWGNWIRAAQTGLAATGWQQVQERLELCLLALAGCLQRLTLPTGSQILAQKATGGREMEAGIQGAGDSSEEISAQLWPRLFSVSEEVFSGCITLQSSLLRQADALAHLLGYVCKMELWYDCNKVGSSGSCVGSVSFYPQPVRSQNYPFWKGISEE